MCAHAVRVALKDIPGVQSVDVSLTNGEATVVFAAGNTVRYEQLLRAIEKNGFVAKGARLVAAGTIGASGSEFLISGSNERLRLEPARAGAALPPSLAGKPAEVVGDVPEAEKGKSVGVIRFASVTEK